MILRTPSFYDDFKCIAGECTDSCCAGWEVDADYASLDYYKTLDLNTEIRKRIDSVLDSDEFGNTIFRLTKDKRCPFLNNDNLCDMHIAIGAEHTPYTCRMFPRFINDFGNTREMGLSFSCPTASQIMFNLKEPMIFVTSENDLPPQLNEIDAQTYCYLVKARKRAFAVVQDRSLPINRRMMNLLELGEELQKDLDDYPSPSDDIDFFDVFKNPELINPLWAQKVNSASIKAVADENFNENIASYFIFRYFLIAVYDYDILSKVKMVAIGTLMTACFGEDSRTIQLWSKETKHSQYNMDRYKNLLTSAKCLLPDNLKRMFI
ncbi:MAG: flagellin lysine-N-methylase [Clostridiales bacterium]|nr:flagellin lysine-N-methylase [Clostridiales bacterium]